MSNGHHISSFHAHDGDTDMVTMTKSELCKLRYACYMRGVQDGFKARMSRNSNSKRCREPDTVHSKPASPSKRTKMDPDERRRRKAECERRRRAAKKQELQASKEKIARFLASAWKRYTSLHDTVYVKERRAALRIVQWVRYTPKFVSIRGIAEVAKLRKENELLRNKKCKNETRNKRRREQRVRAKASKLIQRAVRRYLAWSHAWCTIAARGLIKHTNTWDGVTGAGLVSDSDSDSESDTESDTESDMHSDQ